MTSTLKISDAGLRVGLLAVLNVSLALASTAIAKPGNGKGRGQSPDFVPPGQVDKGVPPGHRRAPIEVVVLRSPPALRIEVVPPRPSVKHVWVSGFWSWETNAYVWLPGAWMPPPEPAAVWVAPRFETRGAVSVFISGFWRI
jgi:hypothetical protein